MNDYITHLEITLFCVRCKLGTKFMNWRNDQYPNDGQPDHMTFKCPHCDSVLATVKNDRVQPREIEQ